MNLEQIRKKYRVSKLSKDKYLLFDKEPNSGSRMVYKYLTKIEVKDNTARVVGHFKPTRYMKELDKQIEKKINSLKYDSEYYMPLYRKGLFEHFIIYDYLHEIGFEQEGKYNTVEFFVLKQKNAYNFSSGTISISINGLCGYQDILPKEVKITLHTGKYSWVEVKAKRKVEDIKQAIDSLLKPLLVSESVNFFETSEKLDNFKNVEIVIKKMDNIFSVKSESYKKELKKRLLEMAEKL